MDMSDIISGRSGLFAFLLVVLVLIVSVVIKYVSVVTLTPAKVSTELEEIFCRVEGMGSISTIKVEFLKEWGEYRRSEECSEAVSASQTYSGNGFEGNSYIVTYADSIEFPGFPTFHREFRIEKPMRR
ncbi:hypothetical protein DRQ25_03545 [Candidatus Fermentibacteria bacterium]|nr:MAG: hypothetical protein DRQ25_03545 [Candidatus Fermentibacteria bacterium]